MLRLAEVRTEDLSPHQRQHARRTRGCPPLTTCCHDGKRPCAKAASWPKHAALTEDVARQRHPNGKLLLGRAGWRRRTAHHCVVIDQTGTVLLSKQVENDEIVLLDLIATIADIAAGGEVCWATDLNAGGAALLIELLAAHSQQLLYIPGRIVHHAAATYRGDGKTDAKDARIIADQARMRTDLQPVRGADQISVDLRLLTARRTDLICDRVRAINRLRATLLECFPALERAFDYSKKAPLILLGGYQTPEGIRRIGLTRLAGWLRKRGCRNSAKMAEKALKAANSQHTVLPTQTTGSALVIRLAEQINARDAEIADVDAQITDLYSCRRSGLT
nr:IS110 family transposase [Arthrobacter sp. ok909]